MNRTENTANRQHSPRPQSSIVYPYRKFTVEYFNVRNDKPSAILYLPEPKRSTPALFAHTDATKRQHAHPEIISKENWNESRSSERSLRSNQKKECPHRIARRRLEPRPTPKRSRCECGCCRALEYWTLIPTNTTRTTKPTSGLSSTTTSNRGVPEEHCCRICNGCSCSRTLLHQTRIENCSKYQVHTIREKILHAIIKSNDDAAGSKQLDKMPPENRFEQHRMILDMMEAVRANPACHSRATPQPEYDFALCTRCIGYPIVVCPDDLTLSSNGTREQYACDPTLTRQHSDSCNMQDPLTTRIAIEDSGGLQQQKEIFVNAVESSGKSSNVHSNVCEANQSIELRPQQDKYVQNHSNDTELSALKTKVADLNRITQLLQREGEHIVLSMKFSDKIAELRNRLVEKETQLSQVQDELSAEKQHCLQLRNENKEILLNSHYLEAKLQCLTDAIDKLPSIFTTACIDNCSESIE